MYNMSRRGITLYLKDIQGSIRKIERYTRNTNFKKFSHDDQLIDAVVRNLSIIGEAVRNIPKDIKIKNPEVAWSEINGIRNKVIHEYFGVDEEILWKTIQDDLPVFKRQIVKLLKSVR
ncbi:MAG: hypothetical protein COV07_02055 [Candidatus Vogelbacteria bacterium CG10_big_fil_rev_8_21_14_0_10_45_14]|uniref:DUF86 domain-containing protein n=1 Tax=Candidatus Vogelbacteria bacterium CG10_big_fil_rev_8_21_14_0_10_45_14 TaxID=1975042 RepID=A0A2H0RLH7_9BACT|nr:MAG: hypothetical protein COV07_02055 [Candidatus Vogelbacteria bacterium CG10_big_fil_rev_8_21_14_0_10_45_14]